MPDKEIVHNALWFAGHDDPAVQRQLHAATHVEIERGVNDAGITGGGGQFGYETLLKHIDRLHAHGKGVILDSYADSRSEVEYELASYFLVSSGRDGLGTGWRSAPGDWWKGYDVKLGAPRGGRYEWQGLLRRDFEHGFVLVNQPGAKTAAVALGAGAHDATGDPRSSVSLSAAEGAVITTGAGSRAGPPGPDPHPRPVGPQPARPTREWEPRGLRARRLRRGLLPAVACAARRSSTAACRARPLAPASCFAISASATRYRRSPAHASLNRRPLPASLPGHPARPLPRGRRLQGHAQDRAFKAPRGFALRR